jgi:tetratricopeptide (TPR) repeat protein
MPSIIEGYNYDIFISYRQKDNKGDKWVSKFVDALKTELEATFKEDISVYFDENPHDRLQETHNVDKSLEGKLKCLILIPILSQTYCDPNSYAWQYEFLAFDKLAREDHFGRDVRLKSGNVASRILPIRIHDLEQEDIKLFEKETGSVLRAIDFIFKTTTGVSRPLLSIEDHPNDNLNKTFYRDQINKVAHAIKEIVFGMKTEPVLEVKEQIQGRTPFEKISKEEKLPEKKKPAILNNRKLLSGITIFAILIIAAILAYPKIFKQDKLEKLKSSDGRISIAVMPFDNLTGDPNLDFWQRGISELLINDLGTSDDISVFSSQTINEVIESMGQIQTASIIPSVAKEAAAKINAKSHIIGNYQKSSNKIRIMINLMETKSGEVLWTGKIDGTLESDFIDLTDSLSSQVKNYLEIKALEKKANSDYREAFPSSADAYRYYIEGLNLILKKEYSLAKESLKKAYEIDTTFSFAALYIAWAKIFDQDWSEVPFWTQKAYNNKDKLPTKYQQLLELWKACYVSKNRNDIQKYCDLISNYDLNSRLLLFSLGDFYLSFLEQYAKAIEMFKEIQEISSSWGKEWEYLEYYSEFGSTYHEIGKHKEEEELYKTGLKISPKDSSILLNRCICAISQNDTLKAEEYISAFLSIVKKVSEWEAYKERLKGMIYSRAKHYEDAMRHYRRAVELDPQNDFYKFLLTNCLVKGNINVDEGMELIQYFFKKYPAAKDDLQILWTEGRVYLKRGEYEKALIDLKKVREGWATYNPEWDQEIQEAEQALARQKNN